MSERNDPLGAAMQGWASAINDLKFSAELCRAVEEQRDTLRADIAALEAENGRLKAVLSDVTGTPPTTSALEAWCSAIAKTAPISRPERKDKAPESLKQELLKEIMADPGNRIFGIPLSEVQRIIAAHRAAQGKVQE